MESHHFQSTVEKYTCYPCLLPPNCVFSLLFSKPYSFDDRPSSRIFCVVYKAPQMNTERKNTLLAKMNRIVFSPPRISTLWLSRVTTADLGDLLFLTFKFELLTQMRHCASKIFCLAWRWVFKWLLEPSGTQLIKHPRQHSAPVSLAGFRSLGLSRKWLTVDPDREKTA